MKIYKSAFKQLKRAQQLTVSDVEEALDSEKEDGEQPSGADDVIQVLKTINVPHNPVDIGPDRIVTFYAEGQTFVIHDLDYPAISVEEAAQWISGLSDGDIFYYVGYPDFNEQFWRSIEYSDEYRTLFHATTDEWIPLIEKEGLTVQNKTRAISTRNYPSAIFTSTDEYAIESYGDRIIEIDTYSMFQDGFTPEVSLEEPIAMEKLRQQIAGKIGLDEYIGSEYGSEGLFDSTVIFQEDIPRKYLEIRD